MSGNDCQTIRNFDARKFFFLLGGHLDERARRLVAAAVGASGGYGAKKIAARAAGVAETVVQDGLKDLQAPELPPKADGSRRLRRPGGGRKRATDKQPRLEEAIGTLVEPDIRGNPESPLQWVSKSLRHICDALKAMGLAASHVTVGRILRGMGFTLQSNKRAHEGASSPRRDEQFRHVNETAKSFHASGCPVISVDAKKKELLGNHKNAGREHHRAGEAPKVEVYDFNKGPKATPYGVYDVGEDEGYVNVGVGPDTAEFAVDSIRAWWREMGRERYGGAGRLYITADGGGSNGSRSRLWKAELQKFADETGLEVWVSHFPPGTSKWNKIEHRLFSYISLNWRGKPLETVEIIVSLIGATTTKSGLTVKARSSQKQYQAGRKVTAQEMEDLTLRPQLPGETGEMLRWNYILSPRKK